MQVTLKLEPMFKRALTYLKKNDSNLGEELVSFGKENEFGDVLWYPSQKKAVYRVDGRVSVNQVGNGLYDFVPFRPTLTAEVLALRATGLFFFRSHLVLYFFNFLKMDKKFFNFILFTKTYLNLINIFDQNTLVVP